MAISEDRGALARPGGTAHRSSNDWARCAIEPARASAIARDVRITCDVAVILSPQAAC